MKGLEIVDLAASHAETHAAHSDVCIVGAGAAGIYLAVALAARGLNTVLLEAGGITGADASSIGFDAKFDTDVYRGATTGRAFGLGGSTSRWGGLLIPHTHHDLRQKKIGNFDPWDHIVRVVGENATTVLQTLGWRDTEGAETFCSHHLAGHRKSLHRNGIDVAAGLLLPFARKNLVWLLGEKSVGRARLRVFCNAVAKTWAVRAGQDGPAIHQVKAVSANGKQLSVTAKRFIVAAGAIESARILLELDQLYSEPLVRSTSATGCYLGDHLSLPIADVAPTCAELAVRLYGPRFSAGWMRSYHFLDTNPRDDGARAFAHFIFDNQSRGFSLAKEALGALQQRRWPKLRAADMVAGVGDIARLAYNRYVHSALYIPAGTRAHLQLDIEQSPMRYNCIKLADELDQYGRRVAKIRWRIHGQDIENIRMAANQILKKWADQRASLPKLLARQEGADATKPHDAYHPVGTCRLGTDDEAVVDENLKVWGLQNLWVVSTGVLPSAGTANPTFTMLCLTERLAGQLTTDRSTSS